MPTPRTDAAISGLVDLLRKRHNQPDRTTRYMRRVDEHMLTLDAGQKLAFLRLELEKWMLRYEVFQLQLFTGTKPSTSGDAWDFAETIAAVGAKIARLEREHGFAA